jgi:hypothetical protein
MSSNHWSLSLERAILLCSKVVGLYLTLQEQPQLIDFEPMYPMETIVLSKFDVAERQLLQVIKMFFRGDDPVSIHTLAEAAGQILSDIGEEFGARSLLKDNDLIRTDKIKEWRNHLNKSKNFFKHADRDKNETHEFKPFFNDFSLLDSSNMYSIIKKTWVPESLVFQIWFSTKYPDLLIEESEFNKKILYGINDGQFPNPENKMIYFDIINNFRNGLISLDNVMIEYGL